MTSPKWAVLSPEYRRFTVNSGYLKETKGVKLWVSLLASKAALSVLRALCG